MLDARKQLTLSDTVAAQFVGHDHPRHVLKTFQQSLEEPFRSGPITSGLNQDVEHNPMLIDRAPEIMLHPLDPDEHFIEVPLVSWPRPTAPQAIGEIRTEFLAPPSHRLVGDDNASFSQDQLHIAQAEAEYVVQPHGVADDLGRKPMAVAWVRWRLHATTLVRLRACRQGRLT
jgi:hypothetical protein